MKEILLNKTDGFDSRLASVSRLLLERGSLLKRLLRDRTALIGLILVVLLVSAAFFAPLLAPNDPAAIFPEQKFAASSRQFPLGTDNLGRCLLSRLMFGARVSLLTAGTASLLIMLIGVAVGTVAGYFGGLIDFVLMRLVDLLLAFPLLVLALAVTGMLGVGLTSVLIGVVSVWWASYARIVRALTISLRERQFIEAARATGISDSGIVLRHIIPNIIASIIVLSTIETGRLLLVISGISFLGLGVQPPTPEWGAMLNDGRAFLQSAPQLMIYPGLAICLTVLGLNLLGDSLRDELDPRL
jgi:peptide/nickel transport system permease protein